MAQAAWYTFNRIDNFGQIDPQGPYYKPDSNILTPPGYPVTELLGGKVTSVQRTGYGQTVITVLLSKAINSLATHEFYEHMHDSTVSVGQMVLPGQLLGHANYSGEGAALGYGFYSGDVYGSGSAWTTLQNDLKPGGRGLLNPVNVLNAAKSGKPLTTFQSMGTIPVTGLNDTNGEFFLTTANTVHSALTNVPGFAGIVDALDAVEQFQPFEMQSTGGTKIGLLGQIPIIGQGLKDTANAATLPSDAIQAVLVFTVANMGAFFVRSFLVLIGLIVIISLVMNAMQEAGGPSTSQLIDLATMAA